MPPERSAAASSLGLRRRDPDPCRRVPQAPFPHSLPHNAVECRTLVATVQPMYVSARSDTRGCRNGTWFNHAADSDQPLGRGGNPSKGTTSDPHPSQAACRLRDCRRLVGAGSPALAASSAIARSTTARPLVTPQSWLDQLTRQQEVAFGRRTGTGPRGTTARRSPSVPASPTTSARSSSRGRWPRPG